MINTILSAGCSMSYYKEHAKEFINDTFECDMSEQYRFFEKHLKEKGTILDLGFGSGRDSLYFLNKGYEVFAIDPEEEFVRHGKELGIKNVYQMKAENINFINKFDGIWACASLLHVPSKSLKEVFEKCAISLKSNGIIYASFKYGNYEGERNGRYYLDLNEDTLSAIVNNTSLKLIDITISQDVRPNKTEKWLNALLQKQ